MTNQRGRWWRFLLWGVLLAVYSVGFAGSDLERWAKESAVPPNGRAFVYVYRLEDDARPGALFVRLDRGDLGRLDPDHFVLVVVEPGEHEIATRDPSPPARLRLQTEEGRVYFVRLTRQAQAGRSVASLELVPYAQGRQEVYRRRLRPNGYLAVAGTAGPPRASEPPSAASAPPSRLQEPAGASEPKRESARTSPAPQPPPGPAHNELAVVLASGGYGLSQRRQDIAGQSVTFEDRAIDFSGALEWRTAAGWAFGIAAHTSRLDYEAAGQTGEVKTSAIMGVVKKYFRVPERVHPYLALALGGASTDLSGPLSGGSSGMAFALAGGVEFRWQRVGIYTELKAFSADTEDDLGQKVDLGGWRWAAGVTLAF